MKNKNQKRLTVILLGVVAMAYLWGCSSTQDRVVEEPAMGGVSESSSASSSTPADLGASSSGRGQ